VPAAVAVFRFVCSEVDPGGAGGGGEEGEGLLLLLWWLLLCCWGGTGEVDPEGGGVEQGRGCLSSTNSGCGVCGERLSP